MGIFCRPGDYLPTARAKEISGGLYWREAIRAVLDCVHGHQEERFDKAKTSFWQEGVICEEVGKKTHQERRSGPPEEGKKQSNAGSQEAGSQKTGSQEPAPGNSQPRPRSIAVALRVHGGRFAGIAWDRNS